MAAMQNQVVSREIIQAFSDELLKLSLHFTNPHRIAAGASDAESGFSPLEHWESLHGFLEVRAPRMWPSACVIRFCLVEAMGLLLRPPAGQAHEGAPPPGCIVARLEYTAVGNTGTDTPCVMPAHPLFLA